LKTGIQESYAVLEVLGRGLPPYQQIGVPGADSTRMYLEKSLHYLNQHPDFDTFDRLEFLTDYALPLQTHLGKLIRSYGEELNTGGNLNYSAEHLFSSNALNAAGFDSQELHSGAAEIALGRRLFMDPSISGNSAVSCASCHSPEKFFQDGLDKSVGFIPGEKVERNAPSLFYAVYQHAQFWDGRARTLVEQIEDVVRNPMEMNGNPEAIRTKLNRSRAYRRMFKKVYREKEITERHAYRAIAAFVRTLHPFNSDFDRYIQGDKQALTPSQMSGFNLFMGKAQCGTCHFAPVFNGLVPPLYNLTEFEVLGTTLTDDLANPKPDTDSGRIGFRPIDFYRGTFKTPTVRNSAATGPYMHNGAFRSLDSLMEFYNRGGGTGLGLDLPFQTLAVDPLNLSESEKKNIVDFLHALTDHSLKSR
jgi:cytochrome c peroxidase